MSERPTTLCAAGNAVVPAYVALKSKGYAVAPAHGGQNGETWCAEKEGMRFLADDLITLLGLVSMYEIRGERWRATDDEVEAFLAQG